MGSAVVPFVQDGQEEQDPAQGGGVPQQAPPPAAGQPQPAPQQAPSQFAAHPAKQGGTGMLAGILRALGGAADTGYQVDPQTGQLSQTQTPQTPGGYAKQIIAGAVQGLAAGASAAPGPGHTQRGLAAGIGAGLNMAQGQDQQKRADVLDNYSRSQQAVVRQAQLALSNQQLIASTHQMHRADADAAEHYADSLNEFHKQVDQPGNTKVGEITAEPGESIDDALHEAMAKNPEAIAAHARGQLMLHPILKGGKLAGYEAWQVTPQWAEQRTQEPTVIRKDTMGEDGIITTETQTIPAGATTNGQAQTYVQTASAANNQLRVQKFTQTSEDKRAAGTNATTLQGDRIRAGAEVQSAQIHAQGEAAAANIRLGLGQGQGQGPDESPMRAVTKQIFDGRAVPPPLGSGRGLAATEAQYADLDKYAEEMGLPKASPAKLIGDYKYAVNPAVKTQLGNLATLTGYGQQAGVLQMLKQASAALGQTRFPALNDAAQWARLAVGDPRVAAYRGLLLDAQDLTAKILAGGGTGAATSDAKLKAGQDLYAKGFNAQQMASTIDQQNEVLSSRKRATLGNNFYLNRWYGDKGIGDPDQQEQASQQAMPGARQQGQPQAPTAGPQTHVFNATAWAKANPQANVQQAIAAAKAQGYQVTQ